MHSYIYLPILFVLICFGCKGAKITNDFYAGVVNKKGPIIGYKHHLSHEDHTNDVDLKAGLDSPDFYITKAKYEFLRLGFSGVQSSSNGSPSAKELLASLDSIYGEACLGNHIARERIDLMFNYFLNEVYPKDNPKAQYNIGIVYIELKQFDKAKMWLKKSHDNGFVWATLKLHELNNAERP